ncbi:putative mannan endo-1,4-beta-mannosidase 9 [Triticum aestivum]|uniref:putative mannan endo-1,4-beta-mannosidase 9 n=1 Tax=Triticum aestivum TaxID=4565 RepID=UPI001D02DAC9|nr:putative mannan endo-1,4-beta-mannosidase 9 [Triticum aestivum]
MATSSPQLVMLVSCLAALAVAAGAGEVDGRPKARGFVTVSGARFMAGGRRFYADGFNAYWLMYMASNPADRSKVVDVLEQASRLGATVVRTWAFSDGQGSDRPLQITPGVYNEQVFVGLDFVIAEAKKRGIYLILSLVNNMDSFGGKKQYVKWARDRGHYLGSNDDFFSDALTQQFYKNHIKFFFLRDMHRIYVISLWLYVFVEQRMITRVNTFTRVAYKDEPTIFAWELMNEPRVPSDLSGKTMERWVASMSAYVKYVDPKHMVEIGMEGFYGESTPERKRFNPGQGYTAGTDFVSNNRIPTVDFATIHVYPDQWMPGSSSQAQVEFTKRWMASHIEDAGKALRKPLLVAEFGWSARSGGYTVAARDGYFRMVYDAIYASVKGNGPCAGGLFWHVMAPGMESWTDGYDVVFERSPTTAAVVSQECAKIDRFTPAV